MQRRNFLRRAIPASAVFPSLLNGFSVKAFGASKILQAMSGAADNDHVLVLIQMAGGNDSLNTVIPIDIYGNYFNVRSNIAIPESKILKLNNNIKTGIHPVMKGLQELYNTEKLSVIQGVGYPSANQSHFRSMDIWLTGADEDQYLDTGWAGRFLNHEYPNFPVGFPNDDMPDPLAIQIGSVLSPLFVGPGGFTSMAVDSDIDFYNLINGIIEDTPNTPSGNELAYLRLVARQTNKYADAIIAAAKKVTQQQHYPDTDLAHQLKAVARLIGGGLKTKVYMVSTGGFDTHAEQVEGGNTIAGTHALLLKDISDAIAAFMKDLEFLNASKRVLGLTFSEFGRRIASNGSGGTDHGAAQACFLFGDYAMNNVLGTSPPISGVIDVEATLPMQYDFRSVYASILRDWFCVESDQIESILLKNYQYLPIIKTTACNIEDNGGDDVGENLISNYPNPFATTTTIKFHTKGGHTLIQIFDVTGRLVAVPVNQDYPQEGTYTITFDGSRLLSAVYYARLQNNFTQQVRTMLKIRQ